MLSRRRPGRADAALSALADVDNHPLKRHRRHAAVRVVQRRDGDRDACGQTPVRPPDPFTSPYDLSVDGGLSPQSERSLHAFGWLHSLADDSSQRVVNESAQVLAELSGCPLKSVSLSPLTLGRRRG